MRFLIGLAICIGAILLMDMGFRHFWPHTDIGGSLYWLGFCSTIFCRFVWDVIDS